MPTPRQLRDGAALTDGGGTEQPREGVYVRGASERQAVWTLYARLPVYTALVADWWLAENWARAPSRGAFLMWIT